MRFKNFCVNRSLEHIWPSLKIHLQILILLLKLCQYEITSCDIDICLPTGAYTKVHMKGTLRLTAYIILYDVLLVPNFQFNLISVSKLTSILKCIFQFLSNICVIQDCTQKRILGIDKLQGQLYKLIIHVCPNNSSPLFPVHTDAICCNVKSTSSSLAFQTETYSLQYSSENQ